MMRIFNFLVGFVFTVSGIMAGSYVAWDLYTNNYSHLNGFLYIGGFFALFGSVAIVSGFRGDSDLSNDAILNRRSVKTWLVYGFVLVQFCILAFQVHELLRYSAEIAPFMRSMSREGDAGVMAFFYFGTILIPAACQFILLPVIWLGILDIAKNSWRGGLIATVAVWLASFSWFGSFIGFVYTIATFD